MACGTVIQATEPVGRPARLGRPHDHGSNGDSPARDDGDAMEGGGDVGMAPTCPNVSGPVSGAVVSWR